MSAIMLRPEAISVAAIVIDDYAPICLGNLLISENPRDQTSTREYEKQTNQEMIILIAKLNINLKFETWML